MSARPVEAIVADALVFASVSCNSADNDESHDELHMRVLALLIEQAESRLQAIQKRIAHRHNSELWHELV